MTLIIAFLALQAVILLPTVFAQDPPNYANSTVPYTIPSKAKYDYAEVLHKVFQPFEIV